MNELFTTSALVATLQSLAVPGRFLLEMFFADVQVETDSEDIHFDRLFDDLDIAPFVSPLVAGKVMSDQGYETVTFRPAYVKVKHALRPRTALVRRPGERIGGELSSEERMALTIAETLERQSRAIDRRLEVMAAEALRTGRVTVTGEGYPTKVVDFGRDPALSKTLGAGTRWNDTGVSPIQDLEAWMDEVADKANAAPNVIVMTNDAWTALREDPRFDKMIDRQSRNGNAAADLGFKPGVPGSPQFRGNFGGADNAVEVYTYNDNYRDDAGVQQKLLPPGTVILAARQAAAGIRAHGAIQDAEAMEAGLFALEKYPKSWVQQDPSVRWLMTQSAPLTVLGRPNATIRATVL